jgi:hypothetical protein
MSFYKGLKDCWHLQLGLRDGNSIADSLIQNESLKLLKIKFRKFSGKVKEWLGFCSEFRCTHGEPEIEKVDKFQYITQGMMEAWLMTSPAASCPLLKTRKRQLWVCEADLKEKNY